ncbi:MAG: 3,4-dihydroxy-2-butanone-4-phosphate synthase, partial [Pseudomonadota bacterium]
FPLKAKPGGVLERAGHTEAAVDIARLAGLNPSGVICEIMKEDGTMARLPDLVEFAREHGLKIGTISDLIAYRHKHDNLVREVRRETVRSSHGGEWEMRIFADQITGTEHVVLSKGDIADGKPVLVRTHALNALEDVLGIGLESAANGPTGKLPRAMEIIAETGRGAVFLFRQPRPSLAGETAEEEGPRVIKQTGLGSQIMASMGMHELILLTDSPETRYLGLDAYAIEIVGTQPLSAEESDG